MKAHFHQLFDYNYHCNKQIIETCLGLEKIPEKSRKLFSHILNAHHLWNARITGGDPLYEVWEVHEVAVWGEIHYDNQRESFGIITHSDDMDKRIAYENTGGRSHSNSIGDILFHILNHSTYHRGQIAQDFRENGIEPLRLDYIFYKR